MPSNPTIRRRSDADIIQFIREMPGGNVPQYAKLLCTTSIRINALFRTNPEAKKLIKAGMVMAAEKGMMPDWATARTERGSLRARDVDRMYREGRLPPFIAKQLERTDKDFRDDALNFFRNALEQSANHMSFETQITDYMDQNQHMVDQLLVGEERIRQLDAAMERVDRLLDGNSKLTALLVSAGLDKTTDAARPMLIGKARDDNGDETIAASA